MPKLLNLNVKFLLNLEIALLVSLGPLEVGELVRWKMPIVRSEISIPMLVAD